MSEVGDRAPEFTLTDHLGNQVSLAGFRGHQRVMLVFYRLSWTRI